LDTCLYEIIYSEYSIIPPPKTFTIPPETPCITGFPGRGIGQLQGFSLQRKTQKHPTSHL